MVHIGDKYNFLTVIKESPRRGSNGTKFWLCQCDCGNQKEIRGDKLQSGHTKSCGCLNTTRRIIDIIGNRYGLLTVIQQTDMRASGGDMIWLCQCDCGGIVYATKSELVNDRKKSCGCTRSKGELKIKTILDENNLSYKREYIFPDLKDKNYLRFDFAILDKDNKLQYLIEYDGNFHYKLNNEKLIRDFDLNVIKEHDTLKNNYCIKNNIPLIRIPYWHFEDLTINDLLLETTNYLLN